MNPEPLPISKIMFGCELIIYSNSENKVSIKKYESSWADTHNQSLHFKEKEYNLKAKAILDC